MGSVAVHGSSGANQSCFQIGTVRTSYELEKIDQKLSDDHWKARSATYESIQGGVDSIRLTGDLNDSFEIPRIEAAADIQSISLLSDDGDLRRFSVSNRANRSTRPVDFPGSLTALLIGTVLAYSIREVDRIIKRNGLRPVVNEVKERRWVIMLTFTILTAYSQL